MYNFQYYVLKTYKGLFRKKHTGNVHVIIAPTSVNESIYLVVLGEIIKEKNSFACQLVIRQSSDMIDEVIEKETEKFKDNFIKLEDLNCRLIDLGQGKYQYSFSGSSEYIKSDLSLTFEPEYSDDKVKIYVLRGNIDLETSDIDPKKTMKMVAMKKLSYLGHKYKG